MRSKTFTVALSLAVSMIVAMAAGASPALAQCLPPPLPGESHPCLSSFGSFSNPNGIAIDESTGDVYVADIGTDTVYKFDANGNPVNFSTLGSNALTGSATPAGSFSFPSLYGNPAAIAVDNSNNPSDASAGDLYVMDAGHGVIDKFSPSGAYLSQIAGFTPATGSSEYELLGLGVDASGNVRIHVHPAATQRNAVVDVFDNSATNHLVAEQANKNAVPGSLPSQGQQGDGFAVGPTGDDFMLYEGCSCMAKLGQQLAGLGQVDNARSGDVAVAADPATGHIYVDDQSSVAEWDTGAINGSSRLEGVELASSGTLVSSFGSLQLSGSSGQGGIAVNGASGDIYVADPGEGNPGEGKVYDFGSDTPAVTVGAAANVTKETATLTGTVNPRAAAVASCEFEYGVTDESSQGAYDQSVSCKPAAGEIGAGSSPVPVSANIAGLTPGLLYHFRLNTGNASGSSTSSDLLATVGPGFGIKGFEVSFLNQDGTPDTQAGSHPYKLFNSIEFNTRYLPAEANADSRYVLQPDGTIKDLTVDLPPGLVGDPNATAKKCTLKQLDEHSGGVSNGGGGDEGCPAESVLGVLELEWANTGYGRTWDELEIQHVNVTINRRGFTFNPTDCNPLSITGSLDSTEGATDALSVPFQATNCAVLKFEPKFAVSTSGKTSRARGASLVVKLTYPAGSFGKDANVKSVKVDLPKQLPSRLTTLQKACTAAIFEANPSSCPADSRVGHAKAVTPLIPVPLEGPAYFVSHGGAKFPELIVVLQGYGVTLDLHGETFISKAGITSSTFHTIPDAPVGSFELTLPEGKFSALAANGNLCKGKLAMPTAFTAQNGAEIHESTKISVTGCAKTVRHERKKTHKKKKKKK